MKLENQVLSINQVQELIELGFDVSKYASVEVNITEKGNKFIISKEFIKLFPKFGDNNVIKRYYSMTIGDIMEILPAKIKLYPRIYELFISKFAISFFCRNGTTAFETSFKENKTFIDALFETLKWCIKEKHLAL